MNIYCVRGSDTIRVSDIICKCGMSRGVGNIEERNVKLILDTYKKLALAKKLAWAKK